MNNTKPITQKAKESVAANCDSPNKYMAALVGDLKSMYNSNKFIDGGAEIGKGIDRATELSKDFEGKSVGRKGPNE
tara:strand:- start:134 stop:361 length:228 start_codon:yes stop_codon:yes gene_type:complete